MWARDAGCNNGIDFSFIVIINEHSYDFIFDCNEIKLQTMTRTEESTMSWPSVSRYSFMQGIFLYSGNYYRVKSVFGYNNLLHWQMFEKC